MSGKILTPEEVAAERAMKEANRLARITVDDYNQVLEGYLKEVRSLRGYTDREPSDWKDSSVARWAQDAKDWIAFRDRVMLWGLEQLNEYASTGVAPMSLEAFEEALREIKCEWTYAED